MKQQEFLFGKNMDKKNSIDIKLTWGTKLKPEERGGITVYPGGYKEREEEKDLDKD